MATTVIHNSCLAGALGGLMAGRYKGSFTALDYAGVCNVAESIADAFITANTASGAALADADNANIGAVVQSVAMATILNSGANSVTDADNEAFGEQIYAASKQALTELE